MNLIRGERLSAERWTDLVSLFESSEQCRDCWCMNHRIKPTAAVTGVLAKEALQNLIREDQAHGVLAYQGEQCVGWCAVDPLSEQPGHDYVLETQGPVPASTWSIHCLYVHPKARGAGVSRVLIKEAIDVAREAGATEVLAFPIPEESRSRFPPHEAEFSGRMSTFMKFGFERVQKLNEFYNVLALQLR